MKIEASQVYFIDQSKTFVINGIYFYDVTDFLFQDIGNYITLSHEMKNDKNTFYYIDFHNDNWLIGQVVNIDPLSGAVNSNETFDTFTIASLPPPLAVINSLIVSGDSLTCDGGFIYAWNNTISRYNWYSSLDGVFYNNTSNPITGNGFSTGNHTIYFRFQDVNGTWSSWVSQDVQISNIVIQEGETVNNNWWVNFDNFLYGMSFIFILLLVFITLFYIMYKAVNGSLHFAKFW